MKWFPRHCPGQEDASLLAADVLAGDEKIAAERHLAECAECRAHHRQLRTLTAAFAEWEKNVSSIEASPAMQARWAGALKQRTPGPPHPFRSPPPEVSFPHALWRELIWPSRYIWAGLAAIWMALLAVNAQLSNLPAQSGSSSSQEIFQAWREERRAFVEWDQPRAIVRVAPSSISHERTQRNSDWVMI